MVTHQTVQLSTGGAKNIFDFEYDSECANMPLLLLNVTTCLHVSVVYALKHFERTHILLRTSDRHTRFKFLNSSVIFNIAYILQLERIENL